MNQTKIPDNLDPESYVNVILCIPDDPEWYQALRSTIRLLTRGRFWRRDDRPDSIKQAQEIGRVIDMTMSSPCNLVDALGGIQTAIQELTQRQTEIALNIACCTPVDDNGDWYGIPVEPDPPAEIIPPDSGDVPEWTEPGTTRNQVVCLLLNALYWQVQKFTEQVRNLSLATLGMALLLSAILLIFPTGIGQYIGVGTLTATIYAILNYRQYMQDLENVGTWLEDWFTENWDEIYCSVKDIPDLYNVAAVFMATWVTQAINEAATALGIPSAFLTPLYGWIRANVYINVLVGDFILVGLTGKLEPNPSPLPCPECLEDVGVCFTSTMLQGTGWTVSGRGAYTNYGGDYELTMLPSPSNTAQASVSKAQYCTQTAVDPNLYNIRVTRITLTLDVKPNYLPNTLKARFFDIAGNLSAELPLTLSTGVNVIVVDNPTNDLARETTAGMFVLLAENNGGAYNSDLTDSVMLTDAEFCAVAVPIEE